MVDVMYLDELTGFTVKRGFFEEPNSTAGRDQFGYGKSIPTSWGLQIVGSPWRRVYASCFSNVASHWIKLNGRTYYLRDGNFPYPEEGDTSVVEKRLPRQ